MNSSFVENFLNEKYQKFNQKNFIENDPIQIPHLFSKKEDIEIAAFMACVLAWGLRKTIIKKAKELLERMDNSPYQFICEHTDQDLKGLLGFKHRTFNEIDLLYFVEFLKNTYQHYPSLENVFLIPNHAEAVHVEPFLVQFYEVFCDSPHFPKRTKKHISSPKTKSACKRINMFLRWMVRQDKQGVDFGIWTAIQPSQLICPLDVHVERVARRLGLLHTPQCNWKAAVELTQNLKKFDAKDPVKYDFALFGAGIEG